MSGPNTAPEAYLTLIGDDNDSEDYLREGDYPEYTVETTTITYEMPCSETLTTCK